MRLDSGGLGVRLDSGFLQEIAEDLQNLPTEAEQKIEMDKKLLEEAGE